MGIAGDMFTAALLELVEKDKRSEFVSKLNHIGIPEVTFEPVSAEKCGITGTHMNVLCAGVSEEVIHEAHHHEHEHEHTHFHASMAEIENIINKLEVSDKVKQDVISIYKIIAAAESEVHGVPVTDIHFHEVGRMDAIADITAVCMLMEYLAPDRVVATPVHVGSGHVHCAHGILPVPAPATAKILTGVPIYGGEIKGELTTPTGGALVKFFADEFGSMPVMSTESIGIGVGRKDFERANILRVMLGEEQLATASADVIELSCNLDDMTPEKIGYASDILLEEGALDVYTTAIGMKKNRPGIKFTVMCKPADKERMVELMMKHTTTIGIRENLYHRYTLDRVTDTVHTEYGDVRVKKVTGYGVERFKYEYEDVARIAREHGLSLDEVEEAIRKEV